MEEYLCRVRYEAERLPRVIRSELHAAQLEEQQLGQGPAKRQQQEASGGGHRTRCYSRRGACEPPPEWARPSPAWLRSFLTDFALLRSTLARLVTQHEAGKRSR